MMDDEMGGFEDEPMTSVKAEKFSGNQLVIENMDDVERKRQKRKRKRKKRLERLGKLAVCVCCVGVIVAIVLTIVLTEAAIAVTSPATPTIGPTPMPAVPTYKPTVEHPTAKIPSPTSKPPTSKPPSAAVPTMTPPVTPTSPPTLGFQENITLGPIQDTYIFTEGTSESKAFGKEQSIFVQTGFRANDAIPDAVALLAFDLASVPGFEQLAASETKKASLKLYHQPLAIEDQNREPAPITVSKLPYTALIIESVSGSTYDPRNFKDGPTVRVPTDATEATFDVTDLLFGEPLEDNKLFLMLQTRNQEQEIGDHFYSRESDTPPELTLSGFTPP